MKRDLLITGMLMSLLALAVPHAEAALSHLTTGTEIRTESRFISDDAGIIPDTAEHRFRTELSGKFLESGVAVVILTERLPAERIDMAALQEKIVTLLPPTHSEQALVILMTGEPNIFLISFGEVGERIAARTQTSWQPFERALRTYRDGNPAAAIDIILEKIIPGPTG